MQTVSYTSVRALGRYGLMTNCVKTSRFMMLTGFHEVWHVYRRVVIVAA